MLCLNEMPQLWGILTCKMTGELLQYSKRELVCWIAWNTHSTKTRHTIEFQVQIWPENWTGFLFAEYLGCM